MKNEIQKCIDNKNIDGLLYIYENKGLLAKTASILMVSVSLILKAC